MVSEEGGYHVGVPWTGEDYSYRSLMKRAKARNSMPPGYVSNAKGQC